MTLQSRYCLVWEFLVPPDSRTAFESHYGAEGSWVRLFRLGPGHVQTMLLSDQETPGRYLTIDRWQSKEAYNGFRNASARQYAELDRECEALTTGERFLGAFGE